VRHGDVITLDGSTGEVMQGDVAKVSPGSDPHFQTVLGWAHKYRRMRVLANADTAEDARRALELGADGLGLVRTEHMFFTPQRIEAVRALILAETDEQRRAALEAVEGFQAHDLTEIFRVMGGKPVTVRLLDPPQHEFVPKDRREVEALAERLGSSVEQLRDRIEALAEVNPMMGLRGCRLSVVQPDILRMQVRAIMEAAAVVSKEGVPVRPLIMVPLTATSEELINLVPLITATAEEVFSEQDVKLDFEIGSMLEVPRACLRADSLAKHVSFFSFGSNDLTAFCYGFSRDDSAKFIPDYLKSHLLSADPFVRLDERGVGSLMHTAVVNARGVKRHIKMGLCGEHGGNPPSVEFCNAIGLDYVSCSPFRVPIAVVAAAAANIRAMSR